MAGVVSYSTRAKRRLTGRPLMNKINPLLNLTLNASNRPTGSATWPRPSLTQSRTRERSPPGPAAVRRHADAGRGAATRPPATRAHRPAARSAAQRTAARAGSARFGQRRTPPSAPGCCVQMLPTFGQQLPLWRSSRAPIVSPSPSPTFGTPAPTPPSPRASCAGVCVALIAAACTHRRPKSPLLVPAACRRFASPGPDRLPRCPRFVYVRAPAAPPQAARTC